MAKESMADIVEGFEGGEGLDIDDEELQKILASLKDNILTGTREAATRGPLFSIHWTVYILAFTIIFGVLGFFSYKLVQSLKEKERKREEKKKIKEMKKKK